jgi:hypothetical protein
MKQVLASDWGKLFASWERLTPDERGFPHLPDETPELQRSGLAAFATSLGVLVTCLREAPELAARRRTRELGAGTS